MPYIKHFLLLTLILKLISAGSSEYKQMKWCIDSEYVGADGTIIDKKSCNIRPCIVSVNNQGFFQYGRETFSMANESFSLDFSDILTLYKLKSGKLVKSDKKFDEHFQVVTYKKDKVYLSKNNKCTTEFIPIGKGEIFNGHFLDNGSFYLSQKTILPQGEYVVLFTANNNGVLKAALQLKFAKAGVDPIDILMDEIFAYANLVSCFFMILVLLVYTVVKELRTTAGLVQICYVAVLAVYFLLVAIRDIGWTYNIIDTKGCYILSSLIHVFDFTRLIWVDIMAFDIWWTLRSIFLQKKTDRRVNYKKFMWYCCIAWALPVVYVIIEILLDEFTTYGPKFKNCTADGNPWYTAGLMVPLQILNTIALVLTVSNLWQIQKSLKNLNSNESFRSGPKENAFLIIKISIAMGTDILLMDTILFIFYGDLPLWFKYTARMYVASVGVILFLIFILKADLLLKFLKRLSISNGITRYLEKRVASKHRHYNQREKLYPSV